MIHYISFIPVAQNIKGHNASIITTIGIATCINQYISALLLCKFIAINTQQWRLWNCEASQLYFPCQNTAIQLANWPEELKVDHLRCLGAVNVQFE